MCASPARPAAAARRRARAGRRACRSRPEDVRWCRLRGPGWGAVRSFVPREDVVGDAPQVVGRPFRPGQCGRGFGMGLGGELAGPLEAEEADVGEFAMSLVAPMWLAELLVALGHVENVVDDLEKDPQL